MIETYIHIHTHTYINIYIYIFHALPLIIFTNKLGKGMLFDIFNVIIHYRVVVTTVARKWRGIN